MRESLDAEVVLVKNADVIRQSCKSRALESGGIAPSMQSHYHSHPGNETNL
jgi:hypothetical protein